MGRKSFVASTLIAATAEAVFDWHEAPGALERLTPPWARVRVLRQDHGIQNGARVCLLVGGWPFSLRWQLEHCDYQKGRTFTDFQIDGPFRSWRHVHRMIPQDPNSCLLEDAIAYELPGGGVGALLGQPVMQRKLTRLFAYRHAITRQAFEPR